MASISHWDADKILQLYLHDYMIKRGMDNAAAIFQKEADICNAPVVIESPDGFLHEWWSIFYEVYASRNLKHQETGPEASSKVLQMTDNERKSIPPIIPHLSLSEQRPQQFKIGSNINKMMEQPVACLLPSKAYDKEQLRYLAKDADPNLHIINANKLKFLAGTSSNHSQQDIGKQTQNQFFRDSGIGIRLGSNVPMDPLDLLKRAIQPSDGPRETEANEGLNLVALSGCPLNNQVLTSLLQSPNYQQQFQVLKAQNQQALVAQVLACTRKNQTVPGSSTISNSQDLKIPKTELSKKDSQIMVQMTQTVQRQYQQGQLQQLQSPDVEKSRKRKAALSSRAGESSMDFIIAADDKPVDENVESFLSNENEHADHRSVPFSNLKRISATCDANERKGFSFEEVGCLHSSKSKVLSCHFSSNGKVLASAGHEKKVFIWNMETFDCVTTSEAHSLLITDVRFKPSSTIFATSSFDRTVKLWDAARPSKSLFKLTGHAEQVISLDFHPRKADLLCSCDSNDIIRLWNVNQCVCMHISKGGSKQVRFQPRFGKFLATATGKDINIIDVETGSLLYNLNGHVKDVLSICWDVSGNYVASVSEDSARVWCIMSGGKCIQELHSNGNKFQSCIFHPGYLNLLIIGGYQSLELWIPTESYKTWTLTAHNGLIAGLADSPHNEMIASASHDHCVKLWK